MEACMYVCMDLPRTSLGSFSLSFFQSFSWQQCCFLHPSLGPTVGPAQGHEARLHPTSALLLRTETRLFSWLGSELRLEAEGARGGGQSGAVVGFGGVGVREGRRETPNERERERGRARPTNTFRKHCSHFFVSRRGTTSLTSHCHCIAC